jgi:hypothetical protein
LNADPVFLPLRATFNLAFFRQMAPRSVLYGGRCDTTIVSSSLSDEVDSPDRPEPFCRE